MKKQNENIAKEKAKINKKIKDNISKYDDNPKTKKRRKKQVAKQNIKSKITIKKVIVFLCILFCIYLTISHIIYSSKFKSIVTQMANNEMSTIVLSDGTEVEKIGREKLKLESCEIPDIIKKAYVSIEDERFYHHKGVDLKRTASAIVNYIIHFGKSSFGGSTITQQLVKNYTGDDSSSIKRKVSEWYRALLLESYFSKDEILDNYLLYIYQGQNVYGVQSGAKYYFDKSLSELSLEQIAFLAGINISPNSYDPFDDSNMEKINKRCKIVLSQMLKFDYISNDEYDKAILSIDNGTIGFKKGVINNDTSISSYHTDALYNELVLDVSSYYDISEKFAKNYLETAGLTIVSTQDKNIQKEQDLEFSKSKYKITSSNNSPSEAAMVIIDHSTGYVLSCNGSLNEKKTSRSYNRATMAKRQTGSSIKPLSVLMPGIDKNIFNAATIYDDTPQDFGTEDEKWYVEDFAKPLGTASVRRATESSQNVPFVHMLKDIGVSNSVSYLKKLGITSLTQNDETLVLALGGLEVGISPLEMAGAYATIANDGVYIEPTFYSSVTKKDGKKLNCNIQKTTKVISKQTAYILKSILQEPVLGSNGTATYCKISGVDVCAKTGTSDENYDRWLCGFTPYYTGVCWFGYDQLETVYFNNKNPAGLIFANVFSRIHNGLPSKSFEVPSGIVSYKICKQTGQIARQGCTNTYEEVFLKSNNLTSCTMHSGNIESIIEKTTQKQNENVINSGHTEIDETEIQKDHEHDDLNTNQNTTKEEEKNIQKEPEKETQNKPQIQKPETSNEDEEEEIEQEEQEEEIEQENTNNQNNQNIQNIQNSQNNQSNQNSQNNQNNIDTNTNNQNNNIS